LELGIGDWGLGIGDWANPQSPIPKFPNPDNFVKKKINKKILIKIKRKI